ncbi:MAG: SPFH domain-containing protein, partial [Clostridia bacterium]
ELFTVDGVEGQIKRTLVSGLSDAIAESKIPALDLAANYEELSTYAMNAINPKIASLGLTLCSFVIENISLPEEVEKSMDKRTSMGVLGNLDQYAKYQAAEAMRDAANNGNGMAGMGVGMGAGAAMGQMFAQSMNPAQQAAPAATAAGAVCSACGVQIAAGAKFCPECGAKQVTEAFCTSCGKPIPAGTKFCPECGAKQ